MSAHAHTRGLPLDAATIPTGSLWRKLPLPLALLGVGGLALAFVTGGDDTGANPQFWYSYLTAYVFWLSLALGGLFFVLVHHATRAGWSAVLRRVAENFMITLPLMGLLGLVIVFFGSSTLYEWTHPDVIAADPILQTKTWFLNSSFYTARGLGYFALWTVLAGAFYGWSLRQDRTGDVALTHKMRRWAPLGLIIFTLTLTFSIVDLTMTLDPHWYSTIYGVYYFGGTYMAIGVALAMVALLLQRSGVLKDHITPEHYHDLGKIGYAFMVFWSYIAFSQFMLIWYANVPEETLWFAYRAEGGWQWVTLVLALVHFAIPLFYFMSRHIKRYKPTLIAGAVMLLLAHYIDMFWLVQPTMSMHYGAVGHHSHFALHIADLLAFIGIGGLFSAVVVWRMSAAPVAAVKDPRLIESIAFENQNY